MSTSHIILEYQGLDKVRKALKIDGSLYSLFKSEEGCKKILKLLEISKAV